MAVILRLLCLYLSSTVLPAFASRHDFAFPVPDIKSMYGDQMRAKAHLRERPVGTPVTAYVLENRTRMAPWGGLTLAVLAAVWSTELPSLEVLVYLTRPYHAHILNSCCVTRAPDFPFQLEFRLANGSSAWVDARHIWPHPHILRERYAKQMQKAKSAMTTVRLLFRIPYGAYPHDGVQVALRVIPNASFANSLELRLAKVTRPLSTLYACSQPLYQVNGFIRQWGRDVLTSWVYYHNLQGVARFRVYELGKHDGDTLSELVRKGLAEHAHNWGIGLAEEAKHPYCMWPAGLDHCLFESQLFAKWVANIHAPDMWLWSYRGNLTTALQAVAPNVAALVMPTRSMGGDPVPGKPTIPQTYPTMLGLPETDRASTPIFNPALTLFTYVHRPSVFVGKEVFPYRGVAALHYSGCFGTTDHHFNSIQDTPTQHQPIGARGAKHLPFLHLSEAMPSVLHKLEQLKSMS